MSDVVVVTGIGGMGVVAARRLGNGRKLVIADFDPAKLAAEAAALTADGFAVTPVEVDVSDRASVKQLVGTAASLGTLRALVHTAGLSPTMATGERVLHVDLLGTEYVLEAFTEIVTEGTVAVCIASMAGYMANLTSEQEVALIAADGDDLLGIVGPVDGLNFGDTYGIAKRVNQLRVERYAEVWGPKGGRVVSISPGIISTPMSLKEITEGSGEQMQDMLDMSPVPRMGTAEDIGAAVQWLCGPEASFVTGCDLRVDGGVTGAIHVMGVGL
jgi:NAD(P)-dependent dehydrogenase (short-subunit alcohol dehydrogenase family)